MSQIKKKFIQNNAIDGTKIQLLNGQNLRAVGSDGVDRDLFYFNSSNELILSSMPKLSSMPLVADDVVRKAYVDAEISSAVSSEQILRDAAILAEETARLAGDAGLQSQINTEKSRIDAILLASDADKDSFAEIVSLINSVDTENDSTFASYVLSNNAALAQEVSDREDGDAALQSNLDAEQARAETAEAGLQLAIDSEASVRDAGDVALQNAYTAEASARLAADTAETSARLAGDAAERSARLAGDAAEETARLAGDAALQSQINSILSNTDIAALDSLSEVVAAFQAADGDLNNAISALGTGSSSALTQEISDRLAGDAAEVSARLAGDAAEASARESAVSAEAASREAKLPRFAKMATTLNQFQTTVDLSHVAKAESVHVFIDRLALHVDDDYTLSTVDGVTRITFTSNLLMGNEAPAAGDLMRCGYAYANEDQTSGDGGGGGGGGGGAPTFISVMSQGAGSIYWNTDAMTSDYLVYAYVQDMMMMGQYTPVRLLGPAMSGWATPSPALDPGTYYLGIAQTIPGTSSSAPIGVYSSSFQVQSSGITPDAYSVGILSPSYTAPTAGMTEVIGAVGASANNYNDPGDFGPGLINIFDSSMNLIGSSSVPAGVLGNAETGVITLTRPLVAGETITAEWQVGGTKVAETVFTV